MLPHNDSSDLKRWLMYFIPLFPQNVFGSSGSLNTPDIFSLPSQRPIACMYSSFLSSCLKCNESDIKMYLPASFCLKTRDSTAAIIRVVVFFTLKRQEDNSSKALEGYVSWKRLSWERGIKHKYRKWKTNPWNLRHWI